MKPACPRCGDTQRQTRVGEYFMRPAKDGQYHVMCDPTDATIVTVSWDCPRHGSHSHVDLERSIETAIVPAPDIGTRELQPEKQPEGSPIVGLRTFPSTAVRVSAGSYVQADRRMPADNQEELVREVIKHVTDDELVEAIQHPSAAVGVCAACYARAVCVLRMLESSDDCVVGPL